MKGNMAKKTKISLNIELPDGHRVVVSEDSIISDLPGALLRVAAAGSARIRELRGDPQQRNSGPKLAS